MTGTRTTRPVCARWSASLLAWVALLAPIPAAAEMTLHFIDVGQGDATLVEFPCGAVLVDVGAESNLDFDGSQALLDYLDAFFERRGDLVRTIRLLALTHPHLDHTRTARAVAERYRIENLITNGGSSGSGGREQRGLQDRARASQTPWKRQRLGIEAPIARQGIDTRDVDAVGSSDERGLTSATIDPIACDEVDPKLHVLWGAIGGENEFSTGERRNHNNHSLVLRIDYGRASVLFTGDLETQAIEALVARDRDALDADVLQVGHHGSQNGTTPELAAAVSPELAVISMGPHCRKGMSWTGREWTARAFGHPRKSVIEILEAAMSGSREPTDVQVGVAPYRFEPRRVEKPIYATGWDGTVVVHLGADGSIGAVETSGQTACR